MVKKKEELKPDNKKSVTKKNEKSKTTLKKRIIKKKNIAETDQNYFSVVEVIVLIIATAIVSLVTGSIVTYNLNKNKINESDKYLKKFIKNYNYVLDNYYKKINKNELINGAIKGMVSTLGDEYSYVIENDESENFNIQLEGEYKGVGIEIVNISDKIVVYGVFEDSPADKAGLKVGDIITKIDDVECKGMSTSDLSQYIRKGDKNSFKLTIIRDNEEKNIILNKELVVIKAVKSKIYNRNGKKVGYISINIFSNKAVGQFNNELNKLEKEKIDALVIDVRNNSGGHLTTATKLISLFLDSSHVIYQTNTKGKIKKYYSSGTSTKKYPVVVLQNHLSASASEMLSAALKEEYNATIVGETSYGKGSVQELLNVDSNVEYKITTKLWLSPKGNSINGIGVKADVEVSMNQEYSDNPTEEKDNQLQEALDIASKK